MFMLRLELDRATAGDKIPIGALIPGLEGLRRESALLTDGADARPARFSTGLFQNRL